jgi:hypothetical protein
VTRLPPWAAGVQANDKIEQDEKSAGIIKKKFTDLP